MKKLKRLHLFLLLGVFLFNLFFVSCATPQPNGATNSASSSAETTTMGNFYTLREAYEKGLLTTEDLQQIADYRNNWKQSPDKLSDELIAEIKEARAKQIRETPNSYFPDITAEHIEISLFYGTYNNNPVVYADNILEMSPGYDSDHPTYIGGIPIYYGHARHMRNIVLYEISH